MDGGGACKWRLFSRGPLGGCHGNLHSVLLPLASRSGLHWVRWLEQAKGLFTEGLSEFFYSGLATWWEIHMCSSHMSFSLITIASWESPCWAKVYQIWFKYESGAFRPYSYLHFGYESQAEDILLIILDTKGSSLHDWLNLVLLINLCWLAWHLAVVSHSKITVDRWSGPMAHASMWIKQFEEDFFSSQNLK